MDLERKGRKLSDKLKGGMEKKVVKERSLLLERKWSSGERGCRRNIREDHKEGPRGRRSIL